MLAQLMLSFECFSQDFSFTTLLCVGFDRMIRGCMCAVYNFIFENLIYHGKGIPDVQEKIWGENKMYFYTHTHSTHTYFGQKNLSLQVNNTHPEQNFFLTIT